MIRKEHLLNGNHQKHARKLVCSDMLHSPGSLFQKLEDWSLVYTLIILIYKLSLKILMNNSRLNLRKKVIWKDKETFHIHIFVNERAWDKLN